MKCYNHPEVDAVAICKNCNKGLCKECASDTENGITCFGIVAYIKYTTLERY